VFYAGDINKLGENISVEKVECPLQSTKEVGLDASIENIMMSRYQSVGQEHNLLINPLKM
jgi:hypothetical protein